MDNLTEKGIDLKLKYLQKKIDACKGDSFLMYGHIKVLEEFKKKHKIK